MRTIAGIDNGISGAIVILHTGGEYGNAIGGWTPMPAQKYRKGNEVDIRTLSQWLSNFEIDEYVIEEPGGARSYKAATSMAGSFHSVRAMLELSNTRWHRITPSQWQKIMLPGCKKGDTKPRALEAARRLWPSEQWLASERCKKPHDGAIDAALIAEYARIHL